METLEQALESLGLSVYYNKAPIDTELPYITYVTYGEDYGYADNHIIRTTTMVQVDYYTENPLDENKELIKRALDEAGIHFSYTLVYETTEQVYHHVFDCEVI